MSYFSQNKTTVWILAAIILFNIAAFATIFYKMNNTTYEKPCNEPRGCFQDFLNKELNLSQAQSSQFQTEKARYHDTVKRIHGLMMEKNKAISALMTKADADTTLLFKASDELGKLYSQTRKLYINHYIALSKICDPEQKKKLDSIIGRVFCCEGRPDFMMTDRKHKRPHSSCNKDNRNKY